MRYVSTYALRFYLICVTFLSHMRYICISYAIDLHPICDTFLYYMPEKYVWHVLNSNTPSMSGLYHVSPLFWNVRQKILDRSKIFSESIQKNFWNVPKFLPDRSKISYGCAVFPSGRSKCRLPMHSACCKPRVFVLKKRTVPLYTRAKNILQRER